MDTKYAIERLRSIIGGWAFHAGFPSDEGMEALTALAEENSALTIELDKVRGALADAQRDYNAVKGDVERLGEQLFREKVLFKNEMEVSRKYKEIAETAEAEVDKLATDLSHHQHDLFFEKQAREKAEAELARWQPLIEANRSLSLAEHAKAYEMLLEAGFDDAAHVLSVLLDIPAIPEAKE